VKSVIGINESSQTFKLSVHYNMHWLDTRLDFQGRKDIPDYFKTHGLNATGFSSRLFVPDTKLTN
jgi:hypothetical protein